MKSILAAQCAGQHAGIYSVCSAHPLVIEAVLRFNLSTEQPVLIEATSNQVNQYGGYTSMQPIDFKNFVLDIAARVGFAAERIIFGGDHLGPNCWQNEPAESAMQKAQTLIEQYVKAGFSKIHLDTSMSCADDPPILEPEVVAERAAQLCQVAEAQASEQQGAQLYYVIGTEVPVPGGAPHQLDGVEVTTVESVQQTIATHQQAFAKLGLQKAFERVIALVVQPGVEFDHHQVIIYQPAKAQALKQFIQATNLVFEAHSTDYQTGEALRQLVSDRFAILKVGPALTFALREAIFALAQIEATLIPIEAQSRIVEVINAVMLDNPQYWQNYYHEKPSQLLPLLDFSLSDRCRYYWPNQRIEQALQQLLNNLSQVTIPLGLLSQYLPNQLPRLLQQQCANEPRALIMDKIQDVYRQYHAACVV